MAVQLFEIEKTLNRSCPSLGFRDVLSELFILLEFGFQPKP